MSYTLHITPAARRQMKTLTPRDAKRIRAALDVLVTDPYNASLDVKKLSSRAGYRLRIGDYRAIYELENDVLIVRILAVAHRRDVY